MIDVRKSEQRGQTKLDWLDGRHSFSFGNYYDPANRGFRSIRVINDDRIAPGGGFSTHPHNDMEIITVVFSGALEHKDSLGNGAVLKAGDIQTMSAGTGIQHSEFNPSSTESTHLLQIWIRPETQGLEPTYSDRRLNGEADGGMLLIASPDARDGSALIHQDAELYLSHLAKDDAVTHTMNPDRHGWIQVAVGSILLNGETLEAGDSASFTEEELLSIHSKEDSSFILFDLA